VTLINYKLVLLINSFSETELEQFRKFISSPYFNKGRNYLPFLERILLLRNNNDSDEKTRIISEIRSSLSLSDQTLRNRFSELYKLGEDFLIHNSLSGNKTEKKKILLDKLLEKKLFTLFNINYKETSNYLSNKKFDTEVYSDLLSLKELHSKYLNEKNKAEHLYNEYYEYSKTSLCYYLLKLFEIGDEFKQQEIDDKKYSPNYVTDFLKELNVKDMMKKFGSSNALIYKVTAMNYNLYKALENVNEEKYYFDSYKIFKSIAKELSDSYKVNVFKILINYCIIKLNGGELKYRYELFDLFNNKLDQNLISDLKNNYYIFNPFRDYVYIGLVIKEFEWVENFINKYSSELPADIRREESLLSYSKLDFERKSFRNSLNRLNGLKGSHYLLYLDISRFKLCNFYELKKFEEAILEIDKQKHYLKYHKEIPVNRIAYNSNFLNILKELIKLNTRPGKADTTSIERDLEGYKLISQKEWLKEKIAEIKQRK
jgi:hypothetical protein